MKTDKHEVTRLINILALLFCVSTIEMIILLTAIVKSANHFQKNMCTGIVILIIVALK